MTTRDPTPTTRVSVPANRDVVSVHRSGGFAGRTVSGQLSCDDRECGAEVRALLARIDPNAIVRASAQPDRFVYVFGLPDGEVTVHEHQLTDDLSRLAHLVLGDGDR